jgi:O-antigen/teichoic acid export membrane protein
LSNIVDEARSETEKPRNEPAAVVPENRLTGGRRNLKTSMAHLVARMRSSQLNRNMGAGSAMALIGTCVSIVSYPIYLHYLGYHRYGLWLVLSVIVSVAQLGNLGIPWALMKLVAEDHGRSDWDGVRTYINLGCGIILAFGLVFVVIVTALRHSVLVWFKLSGADADSVFTLLPYVALLSLLVLLFSTFNSALGGLGRMDRGSYNETFVQILVVAFSAFFLYMGLDLRGMLLGAFLGYLAAQVVSFFQVQRMMPVPLLVRTQVSRHRLRQLLGTGGWILTSGGFAVMFLPFTRLMLSRYAGLEAVAVNDMCWNGSMRVRSVFDAACRPMMPELSGLQANGERNLARRIRSVDRKAFLINLGIALPVFAVLMIAVNPLLHLWLHRSFNPLLPSTFRIALVGAFASLLGSSAFYMLIGLGNARHSTYAAGIQFVVNAVLLSAIAFWNKQISVQEAALAFTIAAICSTLYLRARMSAAIRDPRRSNDGAQSEGMKPARPI